MLDLPSDPIVWSTILQTIVLSLTLIIFIMSFRSQERSTREAAYQRVLDDTTDAMKMVLTTPDLRRIQAEMARTITPTATAASLSPEDMAVRNYMFLLYGIFERAYLLYCKKWINTESWSQFDIWLQRMMDYPLFVDAHRSATGMYDKPFQDYIDGLLDKSHRKQESKSEK